MKTSEVLELLSTEAQIGERNQAVTFAYEKLSLMHNFIISIAKDIDEVYPNIAKNKITHTPRQKIVRKIRMQAEEFIT